MKTSNDTSTSRTAEGGASRAATQRDTNNLTRDGALRSELSPRDQAVRAGAETRKGPQALAESAGVRVEQHASMTPSEFWGSKLGECASKGISIADCRPWS